MKAFKKICLATIIGAFLVTSTGCSLLAAEKKMTEFRDEIEDIVEDHEDDWEDAADDWEDEVEDAAEEWESQMEDAIDGIQSLY